MTQKLNEVGGLPVYFCATYADPTTGTATIDTPTGFYPDLIMVLDNTGTNPNQYYWTKGGNANPGGIKNTGSSGILTLMTANGITVADGTITLGTDVCDNGVTGTVHCWRYSA